jgi:hypothetical protein
MGVSRCPAFPAPSLIEGSMTQHNSGATCRENTGTCPQEAAKLFEM